MVSRDEVLEILFGVLPRLVRFFPHSPHTIVFSLLTRTVFSAGSLGNKVYQPIGHIFLDIIPMVGPGRVCLDISLKRPERHPTRNNRHVSGNSKGLIPSFSC